MTVTDLAEPQPLGRTVKRLAPMVAPSTSLEGRDVALVPVHPDHAAELFAGSHGSLEAEQIWTYLAYGPFKHIADMRSWLAELTSSDDPRFSTVIATSTGSPIGMASFLNINAEMRRLEIGHIWYTVKAQRTTANTEAAYLMCRQAFEELVARRVEWKCDALNERSRQAALRLGSSFEGVLRNHMIVKDRNRDTAYYAISDDDWPSVAQTLRRWLYEEPRDERGRPASSLTEMMERTAD